MSRAAKFLLASLAAVSILVAPQPTRSQVPAQARLPKLDLTTSSTNQSISCPKGYVHYKYLYLKIFNGSADTEYIQWTSTVVRDPGQSCVSDWTPRKGSVRLTSGASRTIRVKVLFIPSCGGTAAITFAGKLQNEPGDTDAVTINFFCSGGGATAGSCTLTADSCLGCLELDDSAICVESPSNWWEVEGTWTAAGTCPDDLDVNDPDCPGCPSGPDATCASNDVNIPAASTWGLLVLLLLVAVSGTVAVHRRRARSVA